MKALHCHTILLKTCKEVEEPGHKWLRDSSPNEDFEAYLHGSPHSALKSEIAAYRLFNID